MAYTMQTVINIARVPLNDAAKTRVTDATMLIYGRTAIQLLLSKRPDLFFGRFLALPDISALALGDAFPVDDIIAPAVADYMTARAESGNDESIVEERAAMFYQLFKGQI